MIEVQWARRRQLGRAAGSADAKRSFADAVPEREFGIEGKSPRSPGRFSLTPAAGNYTDG